MVHKALRYTVRFLLAIIFLWFLLEFSAYLYFRTHKAALAARANTFLNTRVRGSVHIRDLSLNFWSHFPYPALQVNGVTIDDSVYARSGRHTLTMERIQVVPGLWNLLRGRLVVHKLVLEDGSIYLYKDTSNYTNAYVWGSKNPGTGKATTLPAQMSLYSVSINIADSVRHKLYSFQVHRLLLYKETGRWRTDLDVTVDALTFNMHKGSFLQGQEVRGRGYIGFDGTQKILTVQKMGLSIDRQPLQADAEFRFDTSRRFVLNLSSPGLDYGDAHQWLTPKIAKRLDEIHLSRPLAVDARITGTLAPGDPKVFVRWKVRKDNFSGYIGSIDDCSFDGFFTNQASDSLPPSDANSLVEADSLKGKYGGSIAFKTRCLRIVRLDTPIVVFDVSVHNEIATWNNLIGSEDFSFDKGTVDLDLSCKYPLVDSSGTICSATGTVAIRNAEITYVPRGVKIKKGEVRLELDHQDVTIRKLSGVIGNSSVEVTGVARNFLSRATTDTGNMVLDWRVSSPSLDISVLLPFLGQARGDGHPGGASARSGRILDRFTQRCRVNTRLDLDKLHYNDFSASAVSADLLLDNGIFSLPRLSLRAAQGTMAVSGNIRPYKEGVSRVQFNAVLDGIDLSALFAAFDDFGQERLEARNLSGTLGAQAQLSLLLNDKGRKLPGSLNGKIQFAIDRGALLNFQPLLKLGENVLLRNRDFTHVSFSKLYDTFRFSGDTLLFHRMEIQSSVLEMFVEGAYKLNGSFTDAIIQVPLLNLKKPQGLPDNAGVEAFRGPSVYIHVYNKEDSTLHYKFSLFKRQVPVIKKQGA